MKRTDLPPMLSCDGCVDQPVVAACCTIVHATRLEAKAIRRYASDNGIVWTPSEANGGIACGFLQDGQCAIYEVRPWMCRAFGVIKQAPCSRFPDEARVDMPQQQMINLRLSDPNDAFLGWYFEPGYYERMKKALRPHGLSMEVA